MQGILRYAKSVAASLTIAGLAFAARYSQGWLFRDVEELDPSGIVACNDMLVPGLHSMSPMRRQSDANSVLWRVAVVTNRTDRRQARNAVHAVSSGQVVETRSLADQVVDEMYATATATLGFATVQIPAGRARGVCSQDVGDPACITTHPWASQSEQQFYEDVHAAINHAKKRDVLIFVHGFNVGLEQAVARTAQIAEDMPFHGLAITFSWQSAAQADAYLKDEHLAERHFWALAEHLVKLKRCVGDDVRIHVLAHSMGNRVVLRALSALSGDIDPTGADVDPFARARLTASRSANKRNAVSNRRAALRSGVVGGSEEIARRFPDWGAWNVRTIEQPPLANLILAAPDVGAAEFQTMVGNVKHISHNTVLYASDTDFALDASRKVHGGAYRAGDSRAKLKLDGVRTVRVTGVDRRDPLGHSYYGSNSRVLNQLARLMLPPAQLSKPIGTLR